MDGGAKKAPLPKICHTSYYDETWHSYTFPKEDLKYINHVTDPLSTADISIFHQKSANFAI